VSDIAGYGIRRDTRGIHISRSILKFKFKKKDFNTGYNSRYNPIHFLIRCVVVSRQNLDPFLSRADAQHAKSLTLSHNALVRRIAAIA
jgi:hypothetical protein